MRISASWSSFTDGIDVSSTSISVSTTDMSEIWSRTVPGWFRTPTTATSPSSTRLAVTIPSMGARTVVFESVSCTPSRVARACSTRLSDACTLASLVARAVRARSSSATG